MDKELESLRVAQHRARNASEAPYLTRRTFVAGAATAGAVAVLASGSLVGCGSDDALEVLNPDEADVYSVSDTYAESNLEDHLSSLKQYSLPAGSLLWLDTAGVAALLLAGSTASPLVSAALFNIDTGSYTEVLHDAVGADEGYSIYNVRASDSLLVWTELNFTTGMWRVYAATISGSVLGEPILLDEDDNNFDVAPITVSGSTAIWVHQPSLSGENTSDDTHVWSQVLPGSGAVEICASHGRLATQPHVTDGVLCITPRTDTSVVFYRMLACNPQDGSEVASAVLPTPVKPLDVIWTEQGFAFAVEASYDSGGAIGDYGIYLQQGDGFLRLGKIPLAGPVWVSGKLICKTGASLTVLDTAARQYYTIDLLSGCADYGDCFATDASGSRLVSYTTVAEEADSSDASVEMRIFELS